jgi:5'-phosphate synthase pdxT subunit
MRVGVVALQGGVAPHVRVLSGLGATPVEVRSPADLSGVGAIVLPGGESTTIHKLGHERGVLPRVAELVRGGVPLLGTCAGCILAASEVEGWPGMGLGLIGLSVDRNAYGSQVDSFVTPSPPAIRRRIFIRAPRILRLGADVEALDSLEEGGEVVAAGTPTVTVATYHPELAGDPWLHERLLNTARPCGSRPRG